MLLCNVPNFRYCYQYQQSADKIRTERCEVIILEEIKELSTSTSNLSSTLSSTSSSGQAFES